MTVAWGIARVLAKTRRPAPAGTGVVDHSMFEPVLDALATGGLAAIAGHDRALREYLDKMRSVQPDALSRDESLAFWINLYNAGAIALAVETFLSGAPSVLRTPGGFRRTVVSIDREDLSLDALEHGKIRRFGDPRIHGALVCGALSCPTLGDEPYTGRDLDDQLDRQMAAFLRDGGAQVSERRLWLSRVLLWYGSDFVRPHRMPTFIPATKKRTVAAIRSWLPRDLPEFDGVGFQDYDWALGCRVR